jgi:acetyltransferase-like isoleucine patch superfamily enzyme
MAALAGADLAPSSGGEPAWALRVATAAHLGRRAVGALTGWFEEWVLCRGNRAACLRRRGARIGRQTAILNRASEFGTEPWLVEIGSRVTVAAGVLFLTHDGASRIFRDRIDGSSVYGNRFGAVRVLDDCFVGTRAILMPGVTIGPASIVGAGSIVTRDVPPRTVVAGAPARTVCSLDEYVDRYKAEMVPGLSSDRSELRRQLTRRFWGEER